MKDHIVKFNAEETIASIALDMRTEAMYSLRGKLVVVAKYILKNFIGIYEKNKNTLKLKLYECDDPENRLAFVSFCDFTLHIQNGIWANALDGHPWENFILAHELGHIVLHDHNAQAFTVDPNDQLKYYTKETSAEWQANTFASHFLLPESEVKLDSEPSILANLFAIPEKIASNRIIENWHAKKKSGNVTYASRQCIECGKMSVIQVGNSIVCTICPPTRLLNNKNFI